MNGKPEVYDRLDLREAVALKNYLAPCYICNGEHRGVTVEAKGHEHTGVHGVGFIRLLAVGGGRGEFCFRCSCPKSGATNSPNEITDHCALVDCLCHTADVAF